MKESDIKIGETYMFHKTIVAHRKHLIGKPFTVTRMNKGTKKTDVGNMNIKVGKAMAKYYNENNETANSSELKPI